MPITQLLKPLVSFERPAEGASKWANHPLSRLAVAAALAGVLLVLHRHSPDKGARAGLGWGGVGLLGWQGTVQHVCARCAPPAPASLLLPPPCPPAAARMAKEAGRARDEVLDWLGVRNDGYKKLAGDAATSAAANATDGAAADASAGAEAGLGAEAGGEAADAAAAGGEAEL